jgi:hypothetical protein
MKKSPLDEIAYFRKKKPSISGSLPRKLQTKIWLECIFREHDLGPTELENIISKGVEPTRQVYKWLKGKNCITKSKAKQVDTKVPGSLEVFNLPLFDLLKNSTIRKAELDRILSDYIDSSDELLFWRLPERYKGRNDGTPIPIIHHENLDMLYQRGGVFSFIAILYIVRRSEAEGDTFMHLEAVKYAYKSFPSLARHPDFIHHWRDILKAFQLIHLRVTTSFLLVRPDIDIIKNQIEAERFITLREHRPSHPITHRFEDNEPPYREATIQFNDEM